MISLARVINIWCLIVAVSQVQSDGSVSPNARGSISWVKFDSISIPNTIAERLALAEMPAIANWTGLIGISSPTSDSPRIAVEFTAAANGLPSSITYDRARPLDSMGLQLPASLGNGSDFWYFLFMAYHNSENQDKQVDFYIIEMQTVAENETSSPITLFSNQEYLFKINSVGQPFRPNDVVHIYLSRSCSNHSALAAGHIPQVDADTDYIGEYVHINDTAHSLYYGVLVTEDCNLLTVRVNRSDPPAKRFSLGDTLDVSVVGNASARFLQMSELFVSSEPSSSLCIQLPTFSNFLSGVIYASNGNFRPEHAWPVYSRPNNSTWTLFTDNLEPKHWYISVQIQSSDRMNISFLPNLDITPYGVTTVVRPFHSQDLGVPIVWQLAPTNGSSTCVSMPSEDFDLSAQYPSFPGSLRPNFNGFTVSCYVTPADYSGLFLFSLVPVFDTLDIYANVTFSEVKRVIVEYGEVLNLTMGIFFLHVGNPGANVSEGGWAILHACDSKISSTFFNTDHLAQEWGRTADGNVYDEKGNFLLRSDHSGNGWYLIGEVTQPSCSISLSQPPIVNISLGENVTNVLPSPFNDTVGLVGVRVMSSSYMVAVTLQLSTQAILIAGQSGTLPDFISFPDAFDEYKREREEVWFADHISVPALATIAGAAATEFYFLVFVSANVSSVSLSVNPVMETVVSFGSSSSSSSFSSGLVVDVGGVSYPELFRIPFSQELLLVNTDLACVSCSDNASHSSFPAPMTPYILFGAGGLQKIKENYKKQGYWHEEYRGLHISPNRDYFYASSELYDYFAFVPAHSPPMMLTVRPEPVKYLCNPVLLCGGHGKCDSERNTRNCNCLSGLTYGWEGERCETPSVTYTWVLALLVFLALASIALLKIFWWAHKYRRQGELTATATAVTPQELDSLVEVSSYGSELLKEHLQRVHITMDSVSLVVGGKRLLNSVSAHIKAGHVTAIFGPSGAGKSTVMKVLSGRVSPTCGELRVNNRKVTDMRDYFSLIGYVPQEDVMCPLLTVRENLVHSALMRLPAALTRAEKERLVDAVLHVLDLWEKRDVPVGDLGGRSSLSGGQRKRVSIGIELVTCPSVLLLDEPTSGLDSQSALSLVDLLKRHMAPMGIAVVAVLHQPRYEILCLCDSIMLLSAGSLRYFGSPAERELSQYFPRLSSSVQVSPVNVADLLVDNIDEFTWKAPSHAHDPQDTEELLPARARHLPSFFMQVYLLTRRALLQLNRDSLFLLTLYGLTVLSALLVGALYRHAVFVGPPPRDEIARCPVAFQFLCAQNQQDTYMVQGLLISLSLGLTAGAACLSTFGGTEKLVFARERGTGQNNAAYALAKLVSSVPNQLFAALVFTLIFQWLTSPAFDMWRLYIVALGVCDVCMSVAHVVSVFLNDSRALIVTVVCLCMSNVLSGFNPTLSELRDSLGVMGSALSSLSYSRWSMEAFYITVVSSYRDIYDVGLGLSVWDYNLDDFAVCVCALVSLGLALRVGTVLALVFKR